MLTAAIPQGYIINLEGKYSKLVGKIAFCDWSMDRVDKSYTILFYGDDKLLKSYTINKGDLPINISVDLKNCKKLKIEFVRPSGDNTKNPNINLIEFGLVI